jgi:hypothetical protein
MNDNYAPPGSRSIWRSAGVWLALLMGLLQAVYSLLAFTDPGAFAAYRGTPLAAEADAGWVHAYASRTLFVALIVGMLLARRDVTALTWVALLGLVMPASDAAISYTAGASASVVGRHVATMVFLFITSIALRRWARRYRPS